MGEIGDLETIAIPSPPRVVHGQGRIAERVEPRPDDTAPGNDVAISRVRNGKRDGGGSRTAPDRPGGEGRTPCPTKTSARTQEPAITTLGNWSLPPAPSERSIR